MSPTTPIAPNAGAEPTPEELVHMLRRAGISPTAQRLEVARVLLAKPQHLAAEQVLAQLTQQGVSVSKATVYNTLGLFAERGLVREVFVDATRVFYDSNASSHYHFYNVDDGTLADFPSEAINVNGMPPAPEGTETESVDIVVRVRNRS